MKADFMTRSQLKLIPIVLLTVMQVLGSAGVGRSGIQSEGTQPKSHILLLDELDENERSGFTIEELIPVLENSSGDTLRYVIKEISSMGESAKPAIPYLIPLLKNPDPSIRSSVVGVLAVLEESAIIPILIPLLKDPDSEVRWQTALYLGYLVKSSKLIIPEIIPLLQDSDASVRSFAVFSVGLFGEASIPKLRPLLKDPNSIVRLRVAEAFGTMDTAAAAVATIPDLIPLLHDPDKRVRSAAAEALKKLGYKP